MIESTFTLSTKVSIVESEEKIPVKDNKVQDIEKGNNVLLVEKIIVSPKKDTTLQNEDISMKKVGKDSFEEVVVEENDKCLSSTILNDSNVKDDNIILGENDIVPHVIDNEIQFEDTLKNRYYLV